MSYRPTVCQRCGQDLLDGVAQAQWCASACCQLRYSTQGEAQQAVGDAMRLLNYLSIDQQGAQQPSPANVCHRVLRGVQRAVERSPNRYWVTPQQVTMHGMAAAHAAAAFQAAAEQADAAAEALQDAQTLAAWQQVRQDGDFWAWPLQQQAPVQHAMPVPPAAAAVAVAGPAAAQGDDAPWPLQPAQQQFPVQLVVPPLPAAAAVAADPAADMEDDDMEDEDEAENVPLGGLLDQALNGFDDDDVDMD
mgnify:FL=1